MTDNPWLPIDTMPLSTVGTEVDIKDQKRLYSGITVSGIRYERDIIREGGWLVKERVYMDEITEFTITHTRGTIDTTHTAEWRPHP